MSIVNHSWKTACALVCGILVSEVGWFSLTNSDAGIFKHAEFIPMVLSALFLPGLFVSMAVSGNVHDMSLAVAAITNALLYAVILRFVFRAFWRGSNRHGIEK